MTSIWTNAFTSLLIWLYTTQLLRHISSFSQIICQLTSIFFLFLSCHFMFIFFQYVLPTANIFDVTTTCSQNFPIPITLPFSFLPASPSSIDCINGTLFRDTIIGPPLPDVILLLSRSQADNIFLFMCSSFQATKHHQQWYNTVVMPPFHIYFTDSAWVLSILHLFFDLSNLYISIP